MRKESKDKKRYMCKIIVSKFSKYQIESFCAKWKMMLITPSLLHFLFSTQPNSFLPWQEQLLDSEEWSMEPSLPQYNGLITLSIWQTPNIPYFNKQVLNSKRERKGYRDSGSKKLKKLWFCHKPQGFVVAVLAYCRVQIIPSSRLI
jgi:hypothetical protein